MSTEIVPGGAVAFWGAVAQIIPVLAIPLVLEARLVAQRLSGSKDEFARRARRAAWGGLFTILGISMVAVEVTAVSSILFGIVDGPAYWLSVGVILLALVTVFMIPLSTVANSLLADLVWIARARLPWGTLKRTRRRAMSMAEKLRADRRSNAARRLDARVSRAQYLMLERTAQQVLERAIRNIPGLPAHALALIPEAVRAGAAKVREQSDDLDLEYVRLIADLEFNERIYDLAIETADLLVVKLTERIATGASAEEIERLRLQAAQLPRTADAVRMDTALRPLP